MSLVLFSQVKADTAPNANEIANGNKTRQNAEQNTEQNQQNTEQNETENVEQNTVEASEAENNDNAQEAEQPQIDDPDNVR